MATGSSALSGAVRGAPYGDIDGSWNIYQGYRRRSIFRYRPGQSSLDITIDAASVDTRVEMPDNDVRSAHFLDTAKYPTITFKSKKVETAGAGKLKVTGDLTLHGVTKEVVLDVDGPTPPMKDPRGNEHMGASATAKISRQDFGMTFMQGAAGDEVTITIDVEMVKQSGSAPPPAK